MVILAVLDVRSWRELKAQSRGSTGSVEFAALVKEAEKALPVADTLCTLVTPVPVEDTVPAGQP